MLLCSCPWRACLLGVALLLAACGDDATAGGDASSADAGSDAASADARPADGATPDGAIPEDGAPPDAAPDAGAFDPGPEPTGPLPPVPGEVTWIQLALEAGLTMRMGEAGLLVGPDGTLVVVDTGSGAHDDDVREAVRSLNTTVLTPASGFAARTALQVEWVVLTHFHGDHVGGAADLLAGSDPLDVRRGVVHRGLTDLGEAANQDDVQAVCEAVRGDLAARDVPLCAAAADPPCDPASWSGSYPATDCGGLLRGDLGDPADDGDGAPSYLDLGGGARLTLIAAGAFFSDGVGTTAAPAFGVDDDNEENARGVVGLVTHGAFRMHLGGDLTGSGTADEPDVESVLAAVAGPSFYGPCGVDVVRVHHHARNTSSNATFVGLTAPADGRSRNAIASINAAYLGSPEAEVLAAWLGGGRLGSGAFWATETATGGASDPGLIDAQGPVVVRTVQGGRGYWIQAAGAVLRSAAFPAVCF